MVLPVIAVAKPVTEGLKAMMAEVGPDATIPKIYQKFLPRITSLVYDASLCKQMNLDRLMEEGNTYLQKWVYYVYWVFYCLVHIYK